MQAYSICPSLNPLLENLQIATTNEIMRRDSTLLRGLIASGSTVDSGPGHSGLIMKYFSRSGSYYIDTGASQLVADKNIKVKQGQEIRTIKAHYLFLIDGSGWKPIRSSLQPGIRTRERQPGQRLRTSWQTGSTVFPRRGPSTLSLFLQVTGFAD